MTAWGLGFVMALLCVGKRLLGSIGGCLHRVSFCHQKDAFTEVSLPGKGGEARL